MKETKSFTLEDDIIKFIENLKRDSGISSASALVDRVFFSIMLTGKFDSKTILGSRSVIDEICIEVEEESVIEKPEEVKNEEVEEAVVINNAMKNMPPHLRKRIEDIKKRNEG